MGCDIHTHVEYQRYINGENKWLCGDYFYVNQYYGEDAGDEEQYFLVDFCGDRNYGLFATLANVRNYGDTRCICPPKGLPDDVTAEVQEDSDNWGWDGHSHSYFTLKELIDFYEANPKIKRGGLISPEQQDAFDNRGELPISWCQWTSQEGYERREWEEENYALKDLIEQLKKRASELHVIYDFAWEHNYKDTYENADKIRIVFWFDN